MRGARRRALRKARKRKARRGAWPRPRADCARRAWQAQRRVSARPPGRGRASGGQVSRRPFSKRVLIDNAKRSAPDKIALRKAVLQAIGLENASVLDAFAGSGKMHAAVWREAKACVGCDTKFFWDQRTTYVCDNALLMGVIDLWRFNVFDFDAYGSPWDLALTLSRRRKVAPGERIGVVLTDGSSLKLRFGKSPNGLGKLSGLTRARSATKQDNMDVSTAALNGLARAMGCRIERRWRANGKNSQSYFAIILTGLEPADA